MPRRKTHEEFINDVKRVAGNKYDVIGKYTCSKNKITMKHNKCGLVYDVNPAKFLLGNRCPDCSPTNKKTHDKFIKEVFNIVGDEYKVISKYEADRKKIMLKHSKCGYEYQVTPNHFLKGRRCPKCAGKIGKPIKIRKENYRTKKLTLGIFKNRVLNEVGNEYLVVGEYKRSSEPIEMYHSACDTTFFPTPSNFIRGSRCPSCQHSRGEDRINQILKERGLEFKRQFKINDCRNIKPLPFDFAIFKNNELMCLVEYQGRQHYQPVDLFGGEEGFNKTKNNDNIKRQYCVDNNIRLIEIPYHRFNEIDKIIGEVLNYENGRVLFRSN